MHGDVSECVLCVGWLDIGYVVEKELGMLDVVVDVRRGRREDLGLYFDLIDVPGGSLKGREVESVN